MFKSQRIKKLLASTATAAVVAGALIPTAASAATFKDVSETNVHFDAIDILSDEGIINGYSDGTFKPNNNISRGQVAKIFARMIEGEGELKEVFKDVPVTADPELVKAAYEVYTQQIMTGSNGYLKPSSNMTRQQMAKVLVEGFGLEHLEGEESIVTDLDKASPEFRDYIKILSEYGITNVEQFRPTEPVTRAQFASFLFRTLILLDEEE
ncbi:S-layer homology domain-containing protein [Bacillus songklensis]|uniref:S-layer homology domain-containing protein n=1 Tax=Bacillus songklensis TaxID=1069116 RepID=A0ABV8B9B9_9BACI